MTGLTLTFVTCTGDGLATIPLFAFDKIHTNGDVTLSPTRIDGAAIMIPRDRVIGFGLRANCRADSNTLPGAQLDNDVLGRVAAEHPDWSLSAQLQEAARMAKLARQGDGQ